MNGSPESHVSLEKTEENDKFVSPSVSKRSFNKLQNQKSEMSPSSVFRLRRSTSVKETSIASCDFQFDPLKQQENSKNLGSLYSNMPENKSYTECFFFGNKPHIDQPQKFDMDQKVNDRRGIFDSGRELILRSTGSLRQKTLKYEQENSVSSLLFRDDSLNSRTRKLNEKFLRKSYLLDMENFYTKFYIGLVHKIQNLNMHYISKVLVREIWYRHRVAHWKFQENKKNCKKVENLEFCDLLEMTKTKIHKLTDEQIFKRVFRSFFKHLRENFYYQDNKKINSNALFKTPKKNMTNQKNNSKANLFWENYYLRPIQDFSQIKNIIIKDLNYLDWGFRRKLILKDFFDFLTQQRNQTPNQENTFSIKDRQNIKNENQLNYSVSNILLGKREKFQHGVEIGDCNLLFAWKDICKDILYELKSGVKTPLKRQNNWKKCVFKVPKNIKRPFLYLLIINKKLENEFDKFTDPKKSNYFEALQKQKVQNYVRNLMTQYQNCLLKTFDTEKIFNCKEELLSYYGECLLNNIEKNRIEGKDLPWFNNFLQECVLKCRSVFTRIRQEDLEISFEESQNSQRERENGVQEFGMTPERIKIVESFMKFIENHYTFREFVRNKQK